MFAKSKKFVAPLVALLVACMAVEAVTFPANCMCTSAKGNADEKTTRVCPLVGQGATLTAPTNCNLPSQGAYDSFNTLCTTYYPNGDGYVVCQPATPDVPLPQACSCADPSGVNTVAQTKAACGQAGGLGTVVNNKCVVSAKANYYVFVFGCPQWYAGSTAVCSAQ